MSDLDLIRQAAHHFVNEEQVLDIQPFGTGHINDTYAVTVEDNAGQKNLVLQRINHEIFRHPEEVMENILHVTSHLRRKIGEETVSGRRWWSFPPMTGSHIIRMKMAIIIV